MKEYNLDKNGNVIEKAGNLLRLGRMKSKFPLTPPTAFVDHYAYCKTCFHYDACAGMDVEDHMCDLNECDNHISVMTPEEFRNEMIAISVEFDGDYEERHFLMDELMCKLLRSLGYGDGIDIYDKTGKWYA